MRWLEYKMFAIQVTIMRTYTEITDPVHKFVAGKTFSGTADHADFKFSLK